MFCKNCGKEISDEAESCPKCGQPMEVKVEFIKKDKWAAFWLCFFLGGIGAHKYYARKYTSAVLMTLFVWTYIPAFIALIELFIIGFRTQEQYNEYVNKR